MGSPDMTTTHVEQLGSAKEIPDKEHNEDDATITIVGDVIPAPTGMNFQTWMALIVCLS